MEEFNKIKTPEELLKYMDNNITYGFVGRNGKKYYDMFSKEWDDWYNEYFVQTGEELIESKTGTCWDQVELERLWFEKNNYNYKTIFTWFEVNRPNNLPTHTFLIYESDGKYYWFEHADESNKGIHEFETEEDAINYLKEKQFLYAYNNKYDIKKEEKDCFTAYEYTKPNDHLGVDEYINHVTSKKYNLKSSL